jgi:hypothetical protein
MRLEYAIEKGLTLLAESTNEEIVEILFGIQEDTVETCSNIISIADAAIKVGSVFYGSHINVLAEGIKVVTGKSFF